MENTEKTARELMEKLKKLQSGIDAIDAWEKDTESAQQNMKVTSAVEYWGLLKN